MKCPECGRNQKRKYGMQCGRCSYEFRLDPKVAPNIGDRGFLAAVRRVSGHGERVFTEPQLCAALARTRYRKQRTKRTCLLVVLPVVTIVALFCLVGGVPQVACFAGFFAIAGLLGFFSVTSSMARTDHDSLRQVVRRFEKGGPIEGLIRKPSLHEPPEPGPESDLFDYGVERILIVERDILVDLFVRNGWHAEQRALVIAESGYPEYLLPVARGLLEEREDLPVFLLHDSTTDGCRMAARMAKSELLPLAGRELVDVGIHPETVRNMRRMQEAGAQRTNHRVPVDMMPFPVLAAGVAAGLVLPTLDPEQQATQGGFG